MICSAARAQSLDFRATRASVAQRRPSATFKAEVTGLQANQIVMRRAKAEKMMTLNQPSRSFGGGMSGICCCELGSKDDDMG